MSSPLSAPRQRARRWVLVVVALAVTIPMLGVTEQVGAQTPPRSLAEIERERERARAEQTEVEQRLATATDELETLTARAAELEDERVELQREVDELRAELLEVAELMSFRVRESYKHGATLDPLAVFLGSDDPTAALGRVETVTRVVSGDQARSEELVAARTRVVAAETRLAERTAELEGTRARLDEVADGLQADFARLQELDAELGEEAQRERERLEAERRERERRERERREREARERAEREAAEREAAEREAAERRAAQQRDAERREAADAEASTDGGSSTPAPAPAPAPEPAAEPEPEPAPEPEPEPEPAPAPTGGGRACPLDQPRHFSDTWGAARSGGRSHRGTDIMGPHGIPVRAIVSGTWSVQTPGASAGLWGILRGDDGNQYWYMHLASHTVGNGARVSAGQQVGTNGATGNAPPNAPHVHFELHPGGGAAVNPYSMLRSVCG